MQISVGRQVPPNHFVCPRQTESPWGVAGRVMGVTEVVSGQLARPEPLPAGSPGVVAARKMATGSKVSPATRADGLSLDNCPAGL